MMKKSLYLAGLAAVMVCIFGYMEARAAISISPAYVDVRIDKGASAGRFVITNVGDSEERYRIKAIHFTLLTDGGLREIKPDERSLASWVRFNPKEFTLAPKTRQAIRFVILARGNLKPGEYWGAMELESLNTTIGEGKDASGRTLKIEVIPRILVPIFGKIGEVSYEGRVEEIAVSGKEDAMNIKAMVNNTGDGRLFVEGEYEILDSAGKVVDEGDLGRAYVLPGLKRRFRAVSPKEMRAGDYTLKVRYRALEMDESISDEIRFTWNPSADNT